VDSVPELTALWKLTVALAGDGDGDGDGPGPGDGDGPGDGAGEAVGDGEGEAVGDGEGEAVGDGDAIGAVPPDRPLFELQPSTAAPRARVIIPSSARILLASSGRIVRWTAEVPAPRRECVTSYAKGA
jgi:hypothetical protein